MVDFTLTDEQAALRDLAHEFAANEIRPVAAQLDREARWPTEIFAKAHGLGLMNTHVPEAYGGLGLGFLDGVLIEEELAWGCAGVTTSLMGNSLALTPILLGAGEEAKREICEELIAEPRFVAFCLTEPDAGSDVARMRTRAERRGDTFVLHGSKCFITNGSHADWFLVFAKTDPEAGHRGISAFLVRRDETVAVDRKEDKLGQRASDTVSLTFAGTEVHERYLVGEENRGFQLAMRSLDRTRPGVAALATGVARAALEHASAYARERVQFGAPIAMLQGVQFMLADMATKVHLSRLAAWNAAALLDRGQPNTIESAHAKRFAADSAMEVTTDAVQIFGGYGYVSDYPVEKLMRDAKIVQIYEGTSQIQRLVIARETLAPRSP